MSALSFPRRLVMRVAALVLLASIGLAAQTNDLTGPDTRAWSGPPLDTVSAAAPDFDRMRRDQAITDRRWRAASAGAMRMETFTYRSRVDNLDIPVFVFHPLTVGEPGSHPVIVWVHENIRGHLYEHFIPYVRDATARGYVVVAPEYRGSVGYGPALYNAIDYGGKEVDDVVTAVGVVASRHPHVDRERVAVMGWSHGGLIALLSVTRNPGVFRAVAAIVPVTNLFHRVAWKGERQRRAMDPQNRFGGPPSEQRSVYVERSPLFQVDKLNVPVLVHLADNDEDVTIEEGMQLVDALRARKPGLADTKVYRNPLGGHGFDRRVNPRTWQPVNTPEQRDSWNRVWTFLDTSLQRRPASAPRTTASR